MEAAVAETVARATREEALQDARADLNELRRRAVEAGRERSRKIIKTSRIDTRTGEIRYNPSGRLLRDWYLHVYLNALRTNLGEPAVYVDAQQIEDTTVQLSRLQPGPEPLRTLQAVGVVRNVAVDDAAHAATEIVARLRHVAARRAVLHASDERFDGDQVRVHVTRHWYQRCYDDHVEAATRSQQPFAGVTGAEEQQVARTLKTRKIRRLIGRDGIPLLTAHNTTMKDIDRRLAAGEAGVISAATDPSHHTDPLQNLRLRVTRTWGELSEPERRHWIRMSGIDDAGEKLGWRNLRGEQQTKIIRLYLDTHRKQLLDEAFDRSPISAAGEVAARRMFNHQQSLVLPVRHGGAVSACVEDQRLPSADPEVATSFLGGARSESRRH